jgi:hypothetical protein
MSEDQIKQLAWENAIVAASDKMLFTFVAEIENRLLDRVAGKCCAAISSMMNGAQDAQSVEDQK